MKKSYLIEFLHGCEDKYDSKTKYIEDVDDLAEYGYNDKDARKALYLEPNESYIVVDEDMGCKCIQRITRVK